MELKSLLGIISQPIKLEQTCLLMPDLKYAYEIPKSLRVK